MPSISDANRDWKDAMDRAGFQKTRCYDLVHSYCTQLLAAGGGDISLVQKARGHRDIRTLNFRVADRVAKGFAWQCRVAVAANDKIGRLLKGARSR